MRHGRFVFSGLMLIAAVLMVVGGACAGPGESDGSDEVDISDRVQLLDFPPPYSGMLAISNDIDGTTLEEFREIHRFVNTREDTRMGEGLGLDFANSFWFFNYNDTGGYIDAEDTETPREQMSYFVAGDAVKPGAAEEIRHYIRAGWIDTLHSWGDFSRAEAQEPVFRRGHAEKALAELKVHDLDIRVWTNHGNVANIQNFGYGVGFAEYQEGDRPGSTAYHTDLTIDSGVHFVWNSKGSDAVGARSLLFPIDLADGRSVWGFERYTHTISDGEKDWLWGVHDLHRQLSEENFQQIAENGWYSIVANHLGNRLERATLPDSAVKALRRLRRYQDEGEILVARTSRLLQYHRMHEHVQYTARVDGEDAVHVSIECIDDPLFGCFVPGPDEIRGLTFSVPAGEGAHLYLDGEKLPRDLIEYQDDGDRLYVGVKWFVPDHHDYTRGPGE